MVSFLEVISAYAFGPDKSPLAQRSVVERYRYVSGFVKPCTHPAAWLYDRLVFVSKGLLAPLGLLRWGIRHEKGDVLLLDPRGADETVRTSRSFFVERQFKETGHFVSWGRPLPLGKSVALVRVLKTYVASVVSQGMSLADFSNRPYRMFSRFYYESLLLTLAAPGRQKVYVFHAVDPNYYLLAAFCRYRLGLEVLVSLSGSTLGNSIARYFDIDCTVLLNHRVQEEEFGYLKAAGEFRAARALYSGSEHPEDQLQIVNRTPAVDLGFFSSGEWARRGGMLQTQDIETIRTYGLADNPPHRTAMQVMGLLDRLCRERSWTLRIYLHPYERELLRRHGIVSPYADFLKNPQITLDDQPGNSRAKVYEPRVAVSLLSSIIWERLDLGLLDSFIYDFRDPIYNGFVPESLGRFRSCLFASLEELELKIRSAMAPQAAPVRGPAS